MDENLNAFQLTPDPNEQFAVQPGSAAVPVLVVPNDRTVHFLHDAVARHEKTLTGPYRRRGTYAAADIPSLISWAERQGINGGYWFCSGIEKLKGEWQNPKLSMIVIGNYSDEPDALKWHDFRGVYDFPVSDQWQKWAKAHSGEYMLQSDFSDFIEDHLYELASPNVGEDLSESVTRFLEHSGYDGKPGVPATPAQIVELSRGLKLTSTDKVETRVQMQSGQVTLNYTQEHQGEGGRPIRVPQMFFVRIPVFFGQPDKLVGIRLRYRIAGPAVAWKPIIFAPEQIVHECIENAIEFVTNGAHTRVFRGTPDAPQPIA